MPIKTFRGQVASTSVDTISLHTNNGAVGYRMLKLQCITDNPPSYDVEGTLKIYTVPQTVASITNLIDFNDQTLIAVSWNTFGNQPYEVNNIVTVFDQAIFNQDLYITYVDNGGNARPMNYYIELEQVSLDLSENTVATLKDIRNQA